MALSVEVSDLTLWLVPCPICHKLEDKTTAAGKGAPCDTGMEGWACWRRRTADADFF